MFVYLQEALCGTARDNATNRRFTKINKLSHNRDSKLLKSSSLSEECLWDKYFCYHCNITKWEYLVVFRSTSNWRLQVTTSGLKVRDVKDCFAGCYSFLKIVYFSVVYCKDQSYGMAAEESWIVLPILVPVSDLSSVYSVLQISALLKHSIPKRNMKKKYTKLKLYNKSKICQFALFCPGGKKRPSNIKQTPILLAPQLNRCRLI